MRSVRIKSLWDFEDQRLVINGRFTHSGLAAAWAAIDSAIQFNIAKHGEYVIIDKYYKLMEERKKKRPQNKTAASGTGARDPMPEFFKHNKSTNKSADRFHWTPYSRPQDRFALPKPRH